MGFRVGRNYEFSHIWGVRNFPGEVLYLCVPFYLLYLCAPFYLLFQKFMTESAYVSQGSSVLEVLYPLLFVLAVTKVFIILIRHTLPLKIGG